MHSDCLAHHGLSYICNSGKRTGARWQPSRPDLSGLMGRVSPWFAIRDSSSRPIPSSASGSTQNRHVGVGRTIVRCPVPRWSECILFRVAWWRSTIGGRAQLVLAAKVAETNRTSQFRRTQIESRHPRGRPCPDVRRRVGCLGKRMRSLRIFQVPGDRQRLASLLTYVHHAQSDSSRCSFG